MSAVELSYSSSLTSCDPNQDGVVIVGKLEDLKRVDLSKIACKHANAFGVEHLQAGIDRLSPKPTDKLDIWFNTFTVAALPSSGSRHNAPMFPHMLSNIVTAKLPNKENDYLTIVCDRSSAFALGVAVARNFPLYNRKGNGEGKKHRVVVDFYLVGDNTTPFTDSEIACLTATSESIRLAAKIVDMPCNEMHTDAFLDEIRQVGKELGISPMIIQGAELDRRGFGGIYGVGKAAVHQPALAVLSHQPQGATKNIAWCGKGIVYDTGGLSIKGKTFMPGMKRDCGGAAGILGAFRSAVKCGFSENLHAVFCLAENAVGPEATRPDDVHTMYSGLTVEINNTDAEGRLVLGDGVAYARKDLNCDVIVDMATLTGAQGTATGHQHAAILTNDEEIELACVRAGKISGDLCHPLPYCPELHFSMFESKVADMQNHVRMDNASSACAGLFIGKHISKDFDWPGVWLHIDMAYPVQHFLKANAERATGYGVALLLTLFGKHSENSLVQALAPIPGGFSNPFLSKMQ